MNIEVRADCGQPLGETGACQMLVQFGAQVDFVARGGPENPHQMLEASLACTGGLCRGDRFGHVTRYREPGLPGFIDGGEISLSTKQRVDLDEGAAQLLRLPDSISRFIPRSHADSVSREDWGLTVNHHSSYNAWHRKAFGKGFAPGVDPAHRAPHIAHPGDPIRHIEPQKKPGIESMRMHVPQAGDEVLPGAIDGLRSCWNRRTSADSNNAVALDDDRLIAANRAASCVDDGDVRDHKRLCRQRGLQAGN